MKYMFGNVGDISTESNTNVMASILMESCNASRRIISEFSPRDGENNFSKRTDFAMKAIMTVGTTATAVKNISEDMISSKMRQLNAANASVRVLQA